MEGSSPENSTGRRLLLESLNLPPDATDEDLAKAAEAHEHETDIEAVEREAPEFMSAISTEGEISGWENEKKTESATEISDYLVPVENVKEYIETSQKEDRWPRFQGYYRLDKEGEIYAKVFWNKAEGSTWLTKSDCERVLGPTLEWARREKNPEYRAPRNTAEMYQVILDNWPQESTSQGAQ